MKGWKLTIGAAIIVAHALLAAGVSLAASGVQAPPRAPDVARGSQVYKDNCATCHGVRGEGKLGIPNLAGAAGHVKQLGVPEEQAGPAIVKLLRDGIAGNMPPFPPAILSDEDIANLGAYLFTLPTTTGGNLYTANCALCHGLNGEGGLAPALAGAAERFTALGTGKLQLVKTFPDLVRKGIPGKMPGNPQLADGETASLGDYLWGLGSWEADFQTMHGRAPNAGDRADRQWSQQFAETAGRNPTDADWIAHSAEALAYRQVTALDVVVGAPPAGGWKWVVMRRSTGAADVSEVSDNPTEHGNDWVFQVLKGSHEMGTPGGSVVLGQGDAELLPARGIHTHRFAAQSDVLGYHLRAATARPPDGFHRGDRVLYSDQALDTTAGVSYRLRAREFTLGAGQRVPGAIEAGPSFLYVVNGAAALSGGQAGSGTAGQILSLKPTGTLVVTNSGSTALRFVLVDLH